jgi:hypothetical protein
MSQPVGKSPESADGGAAPQRPEYTADADAAGGDGSDGPQRPEYTASADAAASGDGSDGSDCYDDSAIEDEYYWRMRGSGAHPVDEWARASSYSGARDMSTLASGGGFGYANGGLYCPSMRTGDYHEDACHYSGDYPHCSCGCEY